MIESPVLQRFLAEEKAKDRQGAIADILRARFGTLPPDLMASLRGVMDLTVLGELTVEAAQCPGLDAFKTRLPAAG